MAGSLSDSIVLVGAGALAVGAALVYFGVLEFTIGGSIGSGLARARSYNTRSRFLESPDYANYVPDFENDMNVSVRPGPDDRTLDNTLRDLWPPVAEEGGWNPADPPISIRNDKLAFY